jgi:uncharacterized protein
MSPEERDLLTGLFDRIRNAASTPRDKDAETLILDATKAQPYAPYYLAQTVLVQDQALQAANNRLQELEAKVKELEAKAASQPRSGGFLSGLGSLFGGTGPVSRPAAPPPPSPPPTGGGWNQAPPQSGWQRAPQGYAPSAPPQQGPWGGGGGGGGGFLTGALGTAAGVAGGVLLADSIRGLFAGHNNALGIGTGYGGMSPGFGGETIVNNYYDTPGQDLAQQDAYQDGQQDAADDARFADYQQDADQDQDDIQDASDYGGDFGSGDDGSYDV